MSGWAKRNWISITIGAVAGLLLVGFLAVQQQERQAEVREQFDENIEFYRECVAQPYADRELCADRHLRR